MTAKGIVAFRIVGIQLLDLLVVLLGLLKILLLEVHGRYALQAVNLLFRRGMLVQYLLEYINGLLGVAIIVGRIGAGNVLSHVRSCQIKAGIGQAGIKFNRILKMFDSVFVFYSPLISLHTLVELVARS